MNQILRIVLFVPVLLVIGAIAACLMLRPQRGLLTGEWFV